MAKPVREQGSTSRSAGALKLLLVEDSPADAELLLRELSHCLDDFTWERVDNLADLELALTHRPDVALCDVVMPALDGREAVSLMRERLPGLVILVVTGELDDRETAELMAAGADDYLLKDRLGRLGGSIAKALNERRQRDRAAAAIRGQNEILKGIAVGTPLATTLEAIVRLIEAQSADMLCSILMYDDGKVRHGAAPSLPDAWNRAIDGESVGPAAGSCGTAIWRRQEVVVTDIATDPLWDAYRDVALAHGLRACWSRPIFATDARVLGSFAMYYREPRGPTPDEVQLVDVAVGLAAVALEQARSKDAERALEADRELALQALENIADGVVVFDNEFKVISVNPAFERITGWHEAEVMGTVPSVFEEDSADATMMRNILAVMKSGRPWRGEIQGRRKDGNAFPMLLTFSRVDDGRLVATFSDLSVSRDYEDRLAYLAQHDALTRLANREQFGARLGIATANAKKNRNGVGVLLLDIDHFKHVNDSLGHEAGDKLLRALAAKLRDLVRDIDLVARFGGDEFGILLADVESPGDCVGLVQRLFAELKTPLLVKGHELYVSCSVGISLYPQDGDQIGVLLSNADAAMYRAKDTGRGAYQFYSAEMNQSALDNLMIANALRGALANGELVLHYQPRFDIQTRRVCGVEALIRWNRPGQGLVPPGVFIPIAETTGLIGDIGEWAMNEACRQARVWKHAGMPLPVAVNLSGRQFQGGTLIDCVEAALRDNGLDAGSLGLEITESMLLHDPDEVHRQLVELHRRGTRIAVDDFGTGYSALSYLKRFPIDDLKIDRAFVDGLPDHGDDAAIVRAIIAVAKSLGMRTIAEGVENEAQLEYLKALDCDEVQGFLLGKPVPAEEIRA